MDSWKLVQNREVKRLSLSDTMESGTPCKDTISSTYSLANLSMLKVSLIVTKSIVMSSHFHTGTSNCCSRPEGF
uniref:Uncharacterized protein n=1 Tax=Helianthus annuus TaxID=4232 RepID=A0A251SUY4_HELAN